MSYLTWHDQDRVYDHREPTLFVTVGWTTLSVLHEPERGRQLFVQPLGMPWRSAARSLRDILGREEIRVPTMQSNLSIQSRGFPKNTLPSVHDRECCQFDYRVGRM